jgi:hypothetical protein
MRALEITHLSIDETLGIMREGKDSSRTKKCSFAAYIEQNNLSMHVHHISNEWGIFHKPLNMITDITKGTVEVYCVLHKLGV